MYSTINFNQNAAFLQRTYMFVFERNPRMGGGTFNSLRHCEDKKAANVHSLANQ